jgi:hypothetical protein
MSKSLAMTLPLWCFASCRIASGCVFVNSAILAAESVEHSPDLHSMLPIDMKRILTLRMMRGWFHERVAPERQS